VLGLQSAGAGGGFGKGYTGSMATAQTSRRYTAEDLETLPDGDRYEIIEGELQERIMSSLSSRIALTIGILLGIWSKSGHPGSLMGSDGGYRIFPWAPDDVRMPDISFIHAGRVARFPTRGWLEVPPDLAVEVVSPTDSASTVQLKAYDYIRAGVPLVWVVFPESRTVEVRRAGSSNIEVLGEEDTLNGGDVLPGFSVAVSELFPAEEELLAEPAEPGA
jgi:Uma2 family endonuclease